MAGEPGFLGTGWAFPPAFDGPGCGVAMVQGADDVHEALRILFATNPGERAMRPAWGGGLRRMVFEHLDQSTLAGLRDAVEQAVRFHEPRVRLERVDIVPEEALEGVLRLALHYELRSTHTRHNLVLPFYLDPAAAPPEEAA
jgi:uncharacterized protein